MSDKPKDSLNIDKIIQDPRSIEEILQEIHDKPQKPQVRRGDKIHAGVHQGRVVGIFSEGGPQGYLVLMIFLDKNRPMTRNVKWTETGWEFIVGEIAQYAGSGHDDLITHLRADRLK